MTKKPKTAKKSKVLPLPVGNAGDKALMTLAGHNRGRSQFLLRLVGDAEKMEEQKRGISKAVNGLMAEAKQNGFSAVAIRAVMKLRRMDKGERANYEENIAIVKEGLGEQLTMDDKLAIEGPQKAKKTAPDPAAVAAEEAASSAIQEEAVH